MAARLRVQLSNNTASTASEGPMPSGQSSAHSTNHECHAHVYRGTTWNP